ncbi:MAG TPA: bifunctional UDP-N-acetylmuramoyl-tripeptide:D-alanyl-D-alanine ligase/alanine racemase [Bacteroidales bacterium]
MPTNSYTIEDIALIVKGSIIQAGNGKEPILELLIDSRRLISPAQSLFFAIVSKRNNGHKYILDLYEKGVRNFVVSAEPENLLLCHEANFILVNNTLNALQALCAAHRRQFSIPVIGITGSNGKTIVKEWLYQLMFEDKNIVRSPKSYNSQIGVPLSVWQMSPENDIAIFEAGISEPDEMDRLQAIIQPTIGIFTNVGHAHDENFINRNQKIGEKLKLFTKVETLIYSIDDSELHERLLKTGLIDLIETFTWSRKNKADIIIRSTNVTKRQTTISAEYKDSKIEITIPFTDSASVENAIHCWAMMLYLGYNNAAIAPRMLTLSPIAMRLELKEGINNCSLINDSYSSDIDSLAIALDFLHQQQQHRKKTVILSDILQSGRGDNHLYGEIAELLVQKEIDHIIGIGKSISRQASLFPMEKSFFQSTDAFLETYSFSSFSNETILLKGARIFEFERISEALQQKTHETVLEINLNALVHNLNYFRSKLSPGVKLMAMVKAFSYGSGSFEIANTLQFHRVDYLTVAYSDEGVELRKAGINMPIMVMNPDEQSFDSMLKHNLEPEIYSFRTLAMLEASLARRTHQNEAMLIHIKLDTGMHRLGFDPAELDELIKRLLTNPMLKVGSVFSHLATSDEPAFDDFTRRQIETFRQLSDHFTQAFDYPIIRHILNSAGISRFPNADFDMVRLGIGLYGIGCSEAEQAMLENVSTLRSSISQIKEVSAGESVSYNRHWIAERDTRVAIIPIGYADGLSRRLGNGNGHLLLNGSLATIIGSVCMDMCIIDLTGIEAKEGDDVIVFGKELPITKLAADLETIPYEILTGVSRRVKRVYFQE